MKRATVFAALLLLVSSTVLAQGRTRAAQRGPATTYSAAQLVENGLRLNGTGSTRGFDFDGNHLYDALILGVGIDADMSGMYEYSCTLTSRDGKQLGARSGFMFLSNGTNVLTLSFLGRPIGENGVDGPYMVSNLSVSGNELSLVAATGFVSAPLRASEFEGYVAQQPVDTTPPEVTVTVTPEVLWPVSHKLVQITPTVIATDDEDSNPTVELASITCNQVANSNGDGNTSSDIVVKDGNIFVRAERTGNGEDRVYTISFRATDAAGNVGMGSATVTVPHSYGKKK